MEETKMIKDFIKYEIENNDYYEMLHQQDDLDNVVNIVYKVFLTYYDGYYSIWTILDTIERYLQTDKEPRTIEEIVDSDTFELI